MIARRRIGTKDRPRCGHASNAGRAAGASGRDMGRICSHCACGYGPRWIGRELAESLLGRELTEDDLPSSKSDLFRVR